MAPCSELARQSTLALALALALIATSFLQPATVNTAADQAQAPAAGRGQGPGGPQALCFFFPNPARSTTTC
jgi:hypothetical protein